MSDTLEETPPKLSPLLGYGANTTAYTSHAHNLSHLCAESGGLFREVVGGYEYTYTNYSDCSKQEEIQH